MRSKKLYYTQKIAEFFIAQGNTTVKVDELAYQLGVTKKTLYNYFESKQQMIESVVDHLLKQKMEEVRLIHLMYPSPVEALKAIAGNVLSFANEYSYILRISTSANVSPSLEGAFIRRKEEVAEIVECCFAKGIREHLFEDDTNITLLSHYFVFQLQQVFTANCRFDSFEEYKAQFMELLFLFLRGICTPRGRDALRKAFSMQVTEC